MLTFKRKNVAQPITRTNFDHHAMASIKPGETLVSVFKFANMNIDFFGSFSNRSLIIEFTYATRQFNVQAVLTSTFDIKLPILKMDDLDTIIPKTVQPSAEVEVVCQQEFLMNEKNKVEEIRLCLDLETFRKHDLSVRYGECGYLKMLRLYLDIENSFEQALIDKCAFSHAKLIKVSAIRFQIDVSYSSFNECYSSYMIHHVSQFKFANLFPSRLRGRSLIKQSDCVSLR